MVEQRVSGVGPAGIEIAYERLGDPDRPPLLLLMGAGGQLIDWPDGFCDLLVADGWQVIRFDSRDSGRSTHFHDAPAPDIMAAIGGDVSSAAYTLSDMAADAVGLLDSLGIEDAHLVGASLGGMIAQTIAIEYPRRVRSLTSIMSTTGDPAVGQADPDVFGQAGPPPADRDGYRDWSVRTKRASGSPGFGFDADAVRSHAGRVFDRGVDFAGMMRQSVAVLASGDRTARLSEVTAPTLVLHGAADRVFDVSGGRATAAAIPGAKLIVFEGMGHSLPRELWPEFAAYLGALVAAAESGVAVADWPS
ncbi:alpha/beta fold hydrolase [Nocardia sp. NPDC127579]|uniref:alpha/beta fold hydrolase n=1 Tax=Nocardia sp. NPDC127579 TaxID=3345402 RepID=UPI00362D036F